MEGTRGAIHEATAATDGELLRRFAAARDEAAFEELLRRHGALVYGVCRRRLPQPADAEDALQATFLALARQARGMADRGTVAPWLHCVAARISGKLRRGAARRREAPLPEAVPDAARPGDFLMGERLDLELARLPERERAAVLLCGVEGMTRREAARLVGVPEGTFSARLSRGYAALRKRLGHLDPAAALGLAAVALPSAARAAAMDVAGEGGIEGKGIPAAVAGLAKGATAMDFTRRLGTWTAAGLAALALGAAALRAQDNAPKERLDPPSTRTLAEPRLEFDVLAHKTAMARKTIDAEQVVELQNRLVKLEEETAAATAKLAKLRVAALEALRADPNSAIVKVGPQTAGNPYEYTVILGAGKDPVALTAHGAPALARLAKLLSTGTPKPTFVGFHAAASNVEAAIGSARAIFHRAGFAVVDLESADNAFGSDTRLPDRRSQLGEAVNYNSAKDAFFDPTSVAPSQPSRKVAAPQAKQKPAVRSDLGEGVSGDDLFPRPMPKVKPGTQKGGDEWSGELLNPLQEKPVAAQKK